MNKKELKKNMAKAKKQKKSLIKILEKDWKKYSRKERNRKRAEALSAIDGEIVDLRATMQTMDKTSNTYKACVRDLQVLCEAQSAMYASIDKANADATTAWIGFGATLGGIGLTIIGEKVYNVMFSGKAPSMWRKVR